MHSVYDDYMYSCVLLNSMCIPSLGCTIRRIRRQRTLWINSVWCKGLLSRNGCLLLLICPLNKSRRRFACMHVCLCVRVAATDARLLGWHMAEWLGLQTVSALYVQAWACEKPHWLHSKRTTKIRPSTFTSHLGTLERVLISRLPHAQIQRKKKQTDHQLARWRAKVVIMWHFVFFGVFYWLSASSGSTRWLTAGTAELSWPDLEASTQPFALVARGKK